MSFYECCLNYIGLMSSDGSLAGFKAGLEGESLHPMYSFLNIMASIPNSLRPPLSWVSIPWPICSRILSQPSMQILRNLLGQPRIADLITRASQKSTYQFWHEVTNQNVISTLTQLGIEERVLFHSDSRKSS